ncbi:hypothetical protein COCSUDRAFT_34360 [Coccomyxa subellipsoidea C-169]|uniref:Uncharacterized protein n=1 Tax=Coccomyxa subellipsoidea (strain C-169) TaxID=574566 RepID=I0YL50_COCSC|nr:hypothetical protein COCSUDRAFT_34360 [Coccomyxa subellipsoidea C-169]EIE19119.1 hypothetical protein COCSUDRAFT_34360 [Coccomyxa subellipsoidea C-169]|eukprot:XP_005643663.1 hypothetical protein COCSUDRAFT_34360 [Coccomyxa subellipsoidea C-169]
MQAVGVYRIGGLWTRCLRDKCVKQEVLLLIHNNPCLQCTCKHMLTEPHYTSSK